MKISFHEIREAETLPPWYYGLAYTDYCRNLNIYYPIPLNFITSLARTLKYVWDYFRSKPTYVDQAIFNEIKKIREQQCLLDKIIHNLNNDKYEKKDRS